MFTKYQFNKEQIKLRLKECRDGANPGNHKFTQLEFAQKIRNAQGIQISEDSGRSTVSTWEQSNKSIPNIEDMLTICNILEMDFDALIGRTTIDSKDAGAVMAATGLDSNALNTLVSNSSNAVFVNYLLKNNSFSDIVKYSNQIALSSIMNNLINTAFSDSLVKLIKKWFNDYCFSRFPADMSINSFAEYINRHCKISGNDLFYNHFLNEGQNYVLSKHADFSSLSDIDKFDIAVNAIAQISYEYLISANVLTLSRKRISDMFENILDEYIKNQADNLYAQLKGSVSSPK